MSEEFTVNAIDAAGALKDTELLAEWDALLLTRHHLNAMYASSSWVGHLIATGSAPVRLWLVRDSTDRLAGLVAATQGNIDLQFSVKSRNLFRKPLIAAHILGSLPILPDGHAILQRVIGAILTDWDHCDGVYFDALPTETDCWQHVQQKVSDEIPLLLHVADGPRPWLVLDLHSTFDDYLKGMSSKARGTLRRKARQAGKTSRGAVNIRHVTTPEDCGEFLKGAVEVSRQSWQHRVLGERVRCDEAAQKTFEDLARRGMLRSYLLELGDTPCAFVIGYQHGGVFHYAELAFREDCSNLSPGTVLLFHIVEDLHAHNTPATLNFGVGDASYKRRFGNRERSDVSCLLVRRTISNRLLTGSHVLFSRTIDLVKRMTGRGEVTK